MHCINLENTLRLSPQIPLQLAALPLKELQAKRQHKWVNRQDTFENWDWGEEEKNNLLFVFIPTLTGLEVSVPLSLFKCPKAVTVLEQ